MKNDFSSYEKAFQRLEEILAKMNDSKLSLEESITLFEEADKQILFCQKTLSDAEQKVQTLLKNREGKAVLGEDQKPVLKDFAKSVKDENLPF